MLGREMRIQGITIEVSDLTASKNFYENVLGFQPGEYYEPTKWQPYTFADQYFAIREVEGKKPHDDLDITNFELDDVDELWASVKDSATIAEPLAPTPYGTHFPGSWRRWRSSLPRLWTCSKPLGSIHMRSPCSSAWTPPCPGSGRWSRQ